MRQYTIVVEAPHAELGKQRQEHVTGSVNAIANIIVGTADDHPDEPFTFTITATEVHE